MLGAMLIAYSYYEAARPGSEARTFVETLKGPTEIFVQNHGTFVQDPGQAPLMPSSDRRPVSSRYFWSEKSTHVRFQMHVQ
jgi:hypothetical protein